MHPSLTHFSHHQEITNNNRWTLALSVFYIGYCELSHSRCNAAADNPFQVSWRSLPTVRSPAFTPHERQLMARAQCFNVVSARTSSSSCHSPVGASLRSLSCTRNPTSDCSSSGALPLHVVQNPTFMKVYAGCSWGSAKRATTLVWCTISPSGTSGEPCM